MACSCITNKEINSATGYIYNKVKPFEVCPLCAAKHLDYALIKYNTDIQRAIANIYLAYHHLNKHFTDEATTVFNLITAYFAKTLTYEMLETCTTQIHELASSYLNHTDSFELKPALTLEDNLTGYEKIYLDFLIVNELYNFEIGYKDINTPYCIGLLQEATEYTDNQIIQNSIRKVWKRIEENTTLNSSDILNFANEMLYRQNKDTINELNFTK